MADDTRRAAYRTAHIDDLPVEIDDDHPTTEWKPVRRFFGIGSFGTNLARATGEQYHVHIPDNMTECFLSLDLFSYKPDFPALLSL